MTWGLAAEAAEGALERWQELGGTLWFVAGGCALAWVALYALLYALTEPRRVAPGPTTLELGGGETPAVVGLVTGDWDLGHTVVPATLLDLAARGHLTIDQVGDDTVVRLREKRGERLLPYEEMVLDHVRGLARRTPEGAIPAQALTTGPGDNAEKWWRRFRSGVEGHAQGLGLSRPRWPARAKVALTLAAAVVGLSVLAAASTIEDDPDDPDDEPLTGAVVYGVVAFGGLTAFTAKQGGQRDTPAGRESAARWLGLGRMLGEDHLFAEHPPAGVAIWDRHLAYGAALGVAHGAVAALPLGAESETEAWSSVGGRWRVVRVRYPNRIPPRYGRNPGFVIPLGLLQALVASGLAYAVNWFVDGLSDPTEVGLGTPNPTWDRTESALRTIAQVATGVLAVVFALGVGFVLLGVADLVSGRRTVQGQVLRRRVRERKSEDRTTYVTHIAVDDGTSDRIRAWRFDGLVPGHPGSVVRGEVSRYLSHVRGYTVVPAHTAPQPAPHDQAER